MQGRPTDMFIQCDETRPECKKCTTFGYSCNYDLKTPDLQISFDGAAVIKAPQNPLRSMDQRPVGTIEVSARHSSAINLDSSLTFQLDRQSLERLGRFQSRTALLLGSPTAARILRNVAIKLAYSVSAYVGYSCAYTNCAFRA